MDARELRNALGRFATGVCVVTASEGGERFGMTVNSFASLSLDPPLVLWSIGRESDCFARFAKIDHYNVNILREDQQELSARYARTGEHALHDGDWSTGSGGEPILRDVLASFECAIESRIDGGDHVILVGRVQHFSHAESGNPLLFYAGSYAAISQL